MPDWPKALRKAGIGATAGAVSWTVVLHSYFVLTDDPILRDGQYALLSIITVPTGAVVGGSIGFVVGAVSGGGRSDAE